MAELVEVMKYKQRMHKYYANNGKCDKCPLSSENNGTNCGCYSFLEKHPEKAQQIIVDWAKENPEDSNVDKMYQIVKESFGEDIAENFKEMLEDRPCYAMKCKHEDCKKCENHNFWNQVWKDPKECE